MSDQPTTTAAWLRRWWWRRIRRWPGELCQDCARRYYPVVWYAPDELWAASGGRSFLCPLCFTRRVDRAIGQIVIWRPEVSV